MNNRILFLALVGISGVIVTPAIADHYSNVVVSPDMKEVSVETKYTLDGNSKTLTEDLFIGDVPVQEIIERIRSFNSSAGHDHIQGKIVACDSFVDIPGGRNHSYGAFCSLEQGATKEKIAVCNAQMTNAFKMQLIENNSWTKPELIKFVINNCFGG